MQYILAYLLPLVLIIISGNLFINYIKKINFGQQVREYGPKSHLKKAGIPTMGGLLIISVFLLISVFILPLNFEMTAILLTTFIMSLTGFLDDFLKIKFERSLGLRAWQKIVLQTAAAAVTAVVAVFVVNQHSILIPFYASYNLGTAAKFILAFIVVIGSSNAVNLTDGLDGLAAGITTVVTLAFALLLYLINLPEYTLLMLIMAGSTTAFLWFNASPASVFMGDVGSLAIGALLGAAAVFTATELYLLIIGGIYVIETLSVIIQVPYYKITDGKRVFKMTPIHHHFELSGLAENKIVFRFVIITILLSLFALLSLV
ncbi:phospho-N-acetylmuramoyl-pentapeptide-transferase [Halanaerobium saccharolyticum]|uniref:Phospho-N-acetylmuramoyl-pentapeptide-transferase n=1 Tax=Halanaerobium saccharolyticum TaxID=43595 RepID=A0A4R7YWQ5_9FIRM|nr:phospho-N-acetylmuramoyl-pentapeptide-transferase [Halanaerobium saccharolyticum]RAK07409.1 phospho-N-acetylmuramoyl-pentapeptide-transferase [Halanaerobium saccharolyticum]TDW02374.1 phospho-N-acetylmuramoyl-pentapeptide-transferase [Halanaerobium saccharolyticum]TDX59094.1 phospho-N-acetylmuramoyl-pentapeptide-transferase [Halanaerobium saccharolyticum]